MAQRKKLQVFVSSTYEDLIDERQAAVQAILTAGHIPAGMELFAAGDKSQMDVIQRWIDESDVFLLILGGRYGSLEPTSKKSYIQLEYEYAEHRGKPLFAVVITDEHLEETVKLHGTKVFEARYPQQLKDFRAAVLTKLVRLWRDAKDIKLAVLETLAHFIRRDDLKGWIPGDLAVNSGAVAEEMARLAKENASLREQLSKLEKAEMERERSARLNYLDPLLVSARDYVGQLEAIQEKVTNGGDDVLWMSDQFHQVKENPRTDLTRHIEWCNGEGYFAVSVNYLTAVYFFHANKIIREYAKSDLSPSEARTILEGVRRVRKALAGVKGIWETLQDSAGDYVRAEDGSLVRYRKFCEQISRVEERAGILRVLDFYREIHGRTDEERKNMIEALNRLIHSIESMGSGPQ